MEGDLSGICSAGARIVLHSSLSRVVRLRSRAFATSHFRYCLGEQVEDALRTEKFALIDRLMALPPADRRALGRRARAPIARPT